MESHPRNADVHYLIGYARAVEGDYWAALPAYEQAIELSGDPEFWWILATLYVRLDLNAYALNAYRRAVAQQADAEDADTWRQLVALLEDELGRLAEVFGLPLAQVEEGLRAFEDGQRALKENDYAASISASERALEVLGEWPPVLNNLSVAFFHHGLPQEAIATARKVLAQVPENVHALSNAIRFLGWTGEPAKARSLWAELRPLSPLDNVQRMQMAEAAAVVREDDEVYRLLSPLDTTAAEWEESPNLWQRTQLFLGVAEANTGRPEARGRLKSLASTTPWADHLLEALESGRPGPGLSDRFPYFHASEILPMSDLEQLMEVLSREDELPPEVFRRDVASYIARYPQIVLAAEKLLWDDAQTVAGVGILIAADTPAARAALRRFGLSQAGEDEDRMRALGALVDAGEISPDESVRVWREGQWRELLIRAYEVSDAPARTYSQRVADVLNDATSTLEEGDDRRAERLFRRALDLEPRAVEAYNNLGAIYARRKEHERAKEMFRAALEIDPMYPLPRCNLASYLVDEDELEAAMDMLRPLSKATRFRPPELAFYYLVQARIQAGEQELDSARRSLEMALEVLPEYAPAKTLMVKIAAMELAGLFQSVAEEGRERHLSKRRRLQSKLTAPAPTLEQALPLYTTSALVGMSRVILPGRSLAPLRKAELVQRLADGLREPDTLTRMVVDLAEDELTALRMVVSRGGHAPWGEFDEFHGNDLDELPDWEYHVPETVMGRLRHRGLLVETTVDGELRLAIPSDLRHTLEETVG